MQIMLAAIAALALVLSASAAVRPFPPEFRTQDIKTDGATIHVRVGGKGPAVVMLHGFGDTGDMPRNSRAWRKAVAEFARQTPDPTRPQREPRRRARHGDSVQLLAIVGDGVEKCPGLAVEKLDISRNCPAGRRVTGHRAGRDRDHAHILDGACGRRP